MYEDRGTKDRAEEKKNTQWISWNDPLHVLHRIPVINGQGAQWFDLTEVTVIGAIYIQIEINGEDLMYFTDKVPCTTS